jgi:hypothetical protein
MSVLKADTIQSTGGGAATLTKQSAAKAWSNFDGDASTVSLRDSFNVSSITDNTTGDYTTNLTNSMSNADFSCNSFAGTGSVTAQSAPQSLQGIATGSIRTLTWSSSAFDRNYTMNQIFGDLA